MVRFKKQPAQLLIALYTAGCFLLSAGVVFAIATGYPTDDTSLQPGMTVSLSADADPENPKVVRSASDSGTRPIGVSVTPEDNLVTTGAADKQIYVQTDGEVDAYVSDLNGTPKKGDLVSVSPLKGVLVVSDQATEDVVGTALEDFSGDSATTQSIDRAGTAISIKIDKIRVSLDQKGQDGSGELTSLERFGQSITGKRVGEIRVIIALVIFLIVLIAEGSIIYGAVSSAITALGRNPMARKSIVRELVRVVLIAVTVLIIGLAAVYAILWV